LLGSTSLSTFEVTPSSTTVYYIRGEGGCVTPGSCGSVSVTAQDVTAPIVSCPSKDMVYKDGSCEALVPDYSRKVVYSDDCSNNLTYNQSESAGSVVVSSSVIQIEVDDNNGNIGTCNIDLVVLDTISPVFYKCPSNVTIKDTEASNYVYLTPVGLDNCGNVTISLLSGLGSGQNFSIGSNVETYEISDASGNSNTCSFEILVQSSLGVDELEGFKVRIYPVPAKHEFIIEGLKGFDEISISNLNGKNVLSARLNSEALKINVSEWSKGAYLIQLNSRQGTKHAKFLKD